MNLQKVILSQYKENYPQDKLKEISARTNIQITRVFRILNGAEMKLTEYESFRSAINTDYEADELVLLAKKSLLLLSKEKRETFISQFKHSIKINNYQSLACSSLNFNIKVQAL